MGFNEKEILNSIPCWSSIDLSFSWFVYNVFHARLACLVVMCFLGFLETGLICYHLDAWFFLIVLVLVWFGLGYFMVIACCILILSWICWFRQFFLLFLDFFHVHERTTMHAWIVLQSCSFCPYSSPVLINWAIKPEKNTKNIMISSCTTLTSHIVIEVWREEGKDNTQCHATALKGKGKVIVLLALIL